MTVPRDDVDTRSTLIVPNPDCLVVTGGKDPRQFVMEEDSSNIINVPTKNEVASFLLVVPNSDFTVVTSRNEKRKAQMKINSSNRSFMFLDY